MKIVIAGAGETGSHLSKILSQESQDITMLDANEAKLKQLKTTLNIKTVAGQAISIASLRESGVESADLFVAVTPSETENITACVLASKLGAKKTLSRIDNSEYLQPENKDFFQQLGINSMVYPEHLAGTEIINALKATWQREYMAFEDGAMLLVGIKVRSNAEIVNKKFSSGYFDHAHYRIVAIKRPDQTIIPKGSDQILPNDLVYFITAPEDLDFVRQQAGKVEYEVQNIMIMGGSRIAECTAAQLPDHMRVKLIEIDKEKSHLLGEKLNNILVINGDGRDVELLKEEDIEDMDAFVALTDNSETNILACSVAKRFGIKKTIAEIENIEYIPMSENLDIGAILNKKLLTASHLYQLTLNANISNVKCLTNVEAVVMEFVVKEGSRVTLDSVRDLQLPNNVNIGGLIRNGKGITVNGNTVIQPNDHVIVFCMSDSVKKLDAFFH
ncbi:MAG: Trk system potassium transport protein TrkA [Bacteroidetes bacterium]|jgi:trk system potassium uptake protein|nr:Trk system potassium transport protein TrkA [Bacteroidota bacterium]